MDVTEKMDQGQVQYYLRAGDEVNAYTILDTTIDGMLVPMEHYDHQISVMEVDYNVEWEPCDNYSKERAFIMIDANNLRDYAESIMLIKGSIYKNSRERCAKCGLEFPAYWTNGHKLCPFCGEEHGLVYEESN